jgi:hypothetical protein
MSVLCGVAALQSTKTGKAVNVSALLDPTQAIAA